MNGQFISGGTDGVYVSSGSDYWRYVDRYDALLVEFAAVDSFICDG